MGPRNHTSPLLEAQHHVVVQPYAGVLFHDDERRRYYALSPLGKRVLAAEALRLRALVRAAEASRIIDPEPAR